ncbi:MAG: ACP S-malonyltransferase [Myxococcota bacterium]
MKRALIVAPGRGSYGRGTLGILKDRSPEATAIIDECDEARGRAGRTLLRHLDAEPSFRGALHVAGHNASLLTFAASLCDWVELDREAYEVVGVCGNSMGWYTALAATGALPLADAIELVDTMGAYQEEGVIGGQIMTALTVEGVTPDPELRAAVDAAIQTARTAGAGAWWSIDLGSHAVLGADADGLKILEAELPKIDAGARTFPIRLPLHSAFHTPLLGPTSERAQVDLQHLAFQAPNVPLTDGRGLVFRPRWADPQALQAYTLGAQVTEPYDFYTGLESALSHCGADVIVLLGPGNALGGPVSRALQRMGWAGLRDRASFDARQAEDPVLLSFGIAPQRARLVRS